MSKEKPLFIPLKTEFYNKFLSGEKRDELRQYGPRWNEKTCRVGREVTLSKGYGTQNRATSKVTSFEKKMGTELKRKDQEDILACFGTLDIEIAVVGLEKPKRVKSDLEKAAKEILEAWRLVDLEWRDLLEADIYARSDWPETCGREEMDNMIAAAKKLREVLNA